MKQFKVFLGAALAFLTFASVAVAQDPTGPTYAGRGQDVDQQINQGQVAGQAGEVVTGTLPFTGLDIALAVFTGFALLAVGLFTRRLARVRGAAR